MFNRNVKKCINSYKKAGTPESVKIKIRIKKMKNKTSVSRYLFALKTIKPFMHVSDGFLTQDKSRGPMKDN